MSRLDETFARLKADRRAALIPYLPLGYPTPDISQQLIQAVAAAGADVIELGVPFSDPVADGPAIQRATYTALQNGMTVAHCLEMARTARQAGVTTPLVFMGYYNPILRFGVEKFAKAARDAGANGCIIPDLPPDEAGPLDAACRANDLDMIFLTAPTSTPERLQKVAAATRGFMYLISVVGITGARDQVAAGLGDFVRRVRAVTTKPVCVGFGIANADSARRVAQIADGVIVGSALVNKIGENGHPVEAAREFVSELRAGVDGGNVL